MCNGGACLQAQKLQDAKVDLPQWLKDAEQLSKCDINDRPQDNASVDPGCQPAAPEPTARAQHVTAVRLSSDIVSVFHVLPFLAYKLLQSPFRSCGYFNSFRDDQACPRDYGHQLVAVRSPNSDKFNVTAGLLQPLDRREYAYVLFRGSRNQTAQYA